MKTADGQVTRESIRSYLRLTSSPREVPVRTVSAKKIDGGEQREITYRDATGVSVPALLFLPDRPTTGALLVQHQHASNWRAGKSEVACESGEPLHGWGTRLVKDGWVVLAPDAPGFESRRFTWEQDDDPSNDWLRYLTLAAHRQAEGGLLMTEILNGLSASVTVLQQESGVEEVGFLGHSHGGNVGQLLVALDRRIAFSCLSGCCTGWRQKIERKIPLEFSLMLPGVLNYFDLPDLYRLIAPRPTLVLSAKQDPYSFGASEILKQAGSWAQLTHEEFAGEHQLTRERVEVATEWLNERRTRGSVARHGALRLAVSADADAIHKVHLAAVRSCCGSVYGMAQIEAWLRNRSPEGYQERIHRGEMEVLELEGNVVGFNHAVEGEVVAVFVHPEFQGKGLGRQLLVAAMDRAGSRVGLEATLNAVPFYEHCGFHTVEPRTVTRGGSPMTVMWMTRGTSLMREVLTLEKLLLDPEVRADAAQVAALLHAKCREFCSSGVESSREEILEALRHEAPKGQYEIRSPILTELGATHALLTYRLVHHDQRESQRSSTWRRTGGKWQLLFHQGTPCSPFERG